MIYQSKTYFFAVLFGFGLFLDLHGQATSQSPTNSGAPGDYLGWEAGVSDDLRISTHSNTLNTGIGVKTESQLSSSLFINSMGIGMNTSVSLPPLHVNMGPQHDESIGFRASTELPLGFPNVAVVRAGNFEVRSNGVLNTAVATKVGDESGDGPFSDRNIGVMSIIQCNSTIPKQYALYGEANSGQNSWAGFFDGDVYGSGSWPSSSDLNYKEDVQVIESALAIISELKPRKFKYRTEDYSQLALPEGNHYGFIAQEISQILPDLIKSAKSISTINEDEELVSEGVEFLSVNYIELIPIVTKALQERQELLNLQGQSIQQLESEISSLETMIIESF